MKVLLEKGVWISDGLGDFARTLREENAKKFDSVEAAEEALGMAREYRPFRGACICQNISDLDQKPKPTQIPFEKWYKDLDLEKEECDDCPGGSGRHDCDDCNGEGVVDEDCETCGQRREVDCGLCGGSGEYACSGCGGLGFKYVNDIKRLAGQGIFLHKEAASDELLFVCDLRYQFRIISETDIAAYNKAIKERGHA